MPQLFFMSGRFLGNLLLCLVCLSCGSLRGQNAVDVREDPIRVKVDLVTLRFTVKDSGGEFLNRLSANDFTVTENDQLKEIAFFDPPREPMGGTRPLWLAFLLDVSGSTFATRAEEILAAQSFFENIHHFTKVGIFGFTDELLTFQDFTPDRERALRAFGAAREHLGRTAIYDSLNRLIRIVSDRADPEDQRVIILVSDGIDRAHERAVASAALARESGAVVYTIWVPSASQLYIGPAQSADHRATERALKEQAFASLSAQTGGRHYGGFEAILDFDNVLAEINDELFGNLYSIGYYTDRPHLAREERRITLGPRPGGASIHGLFEKIPDRVEAKRRYIAALFDNEALSEFPEQDEVFREIPAEVDVLRPRGSGEETSLPFRLKIGSFSLVRDERGDIRTQLGVIGVLTDLDGNEVVRLREVFRARMDARDLRDGRGIIYNNRLFAPPGNYLFKLALLEIPTWRMTVMERPVRIAPATPRWP
jgi:VWFA-related protein